MFYLVRQWWSTYYSFWSSTCVDVLSDPCCHVFNVFRVKRCPIRHYPQWFCKSLFFIYVIFALCITYVGVQPDFHSRRYIFLYLVPFETCSRHHEYIWNIIELMLTNIQLINQSISYGGWETMQYCYHNHIVKSKFWIIMTVKKKSEVLLN